jgi:hypothetical protein
MAVGMTVRNGYWRGNAEISEVCTSAMTRTSLSFFNVNYASVENKRDRTLNLASVRKQSITPASV